LHDSIPIDRQNLVMCAVFGRRTGNPDVALGCLRGQTVDVADGVQHGFVPRNWQPSQLLAEPSTVRYHIIHFAVVSEYVDGNLGPDQILRKVIFDCRPGLLEGHAGYKNASVNPQADGTVLEDQVFTPDLLDRLSLSQGHDGSRVLDSHLLEM